MGAIKEEIEIIGVRKSKKILSLFDSGASRNYIKREFTDGENVEDIGFHIYEGIHRVILANGDIAEGEKVRFKGVRIKDHTEKDPEFVIIDNLVEDAIIGFYLMQKLGIHIDFTTEKIKVVMVK